VFLADHKNSIVHQPEYAAELTDAQLEDSHESSAIRLSSSCQVQQSTKGLSSSSPLVTDPNQNPSLFRISEDPRI
jgi:hypothetical protein